MPPYILRLRESDLPDSPLTYEFAAAAAAAQEAWMSQCVELEQAEELGVAAAAAMHRTRRNREQRELFSIYLFFSLSLFLILEYSFWP